MPVARPLDLGAATDDAADTAAVEQRPVGLGGRASAPPSLRSPAAAATVAAGRRADAERDPVPARVTGAELERTPRAVPGGPAAAGPPAPSAARCGGSRSRAPDRRPRRRGSCRRARPRRAARRCRSPAARPRHTRGGAAGRTGRSTSSSSWSSMRLPLSEAQMADDHLLPLGLVGTRRGGEPPGDRDGIGETRSTSDVGGDGEHGRGVTTTGERRHRPGPRTSASAMTSSSTARGSAARPARCGRGGSGSDWPNTKPVSTSSRVMR